MKAIEIKGKVNTALCYAKVVEEEAIGQIRRMCDYAVTEFSDLYYARCACRKGMYDRNNNDHSR